MEEHDRDLLEAIPCALMVIDRVGQIRVLNSAAEKLFGYPREDLLGGAFERLLPARSRARHAAYAEAFFREPHVRLMGEGKELSVLRKDGTELPLEFGYAPFPLGKEELVLISMVDVSKCKQVEKTLWESQERLALVIEGTNDGVWDWNVLTNEVYFSPRWKSMLGFADHEIKNHFSSWEELLHPEDKEQALAAVKNYIQGRTTAYELEHRLRHKNGGYRWILARGVVLRDEEGKPTRMAGSHVDLTERKLVEARLRQANAELAQSQETLRSTLEQLQASHEKLKAIQLELIQSAKLESVGTLAAGVAHEVKNPLQIILMGLGLIEKCLPAADKILPQVLEEMKDAVSRADAIVCELLHFSAAGKFELKQHNLNAVVERSLWLVQHEVKSTNTLLCCELDPNLPLAGLDQGKIEQVLINLLLNALQAMPPGGALKIRTRSGMPATEVPNEWLSTRFQPDAPVVFIEVEDNGPGIPTETMPKLFDPFFTTKPVGKGTGLGLSVVKRIIDLHGGAITIKNIAPVGVKVTLALKAEKA